MASHLFQSQHSVKTTVPIKTFRNYWQSQSEALERYQSLDIWGARASTLVNSGWTPRRINGPHVMWANTEGTNWSSEVPTDPMVMPKRQNWREGREGRRLECGTKQLKRMLVFFLEWAKSRKPWVDWALTTSIFRITGKSNEVSRGMQWRPRRIQGMKTQLWSPISMEVFKPICTHQQSYIGIYQQILPSPGLGDKRNEESKVQITLH